MKHIIVPLIIYFTTAFAVTAQTQDPLGKSQQWTSLLETPQDLTLWLKYIGKPINKIEDTDIFNILKWSQMLVPNNEMPVIGNPFWWHATLQTQDDLKGKMERHLFHKELEQEAAKPLTEVDELITDIEGNFLLIEDILLQAFSEIGIKYQSYHQVHPAHNYAKLGWVSEKQQELRSLKMLNIRLLKLKQSFN